MLTTVVAGNCGFSIAPVRRGQRELIARTMEKVEDMDPATLLEGVPWDFETFPEYLASVERRGTVLNYSALIGHTALRLFVMGDDAVGREATEAEIAEMAHAVTEAMDAGACGFASSFAITHRGADGNPIPSRYADRVEIEALCRAVGDTGRGVIAVNGGDNLSLAGCYELQPSIGRPFTFTAVLTMPNGTHLKAIELNRAGWQAGAEVWPQVSPRPLSFSMNLVEPFTLNINSVFAELMPRSLAERLAAYADPAWRARATAEWESGQRLAPRWDTYEIMESAAHPELIGRRLTAVADEMGRHPFDAMLDLALQEADLRQIRIRAVLANDDAEGVALLLTEPNMTLGLSDAGAHVGQLCDAPQATDLLGNWVRERQVMPIEAAVRKLSGQQADIFGFADRGYLRAGAFADVVVFDPDTVAPGPLRRVWDFPANGERLTADAPVGVHHVFVNGSPIRMDGAALPDVSDRRPGRLVRPA